MVESNGGAVKHLPEPEERLTRVETFTVDFRKMASLEGNVLGIKRKAEDIAGQLGSEREVELSAMRPAQIELIELVAHDLGAAFRGAVPDELFIEKLEPAAVDFFSLRRGMWGAARIRCHTDWTIHHGGRMHRVRRGGAWGGFGRGWGAWGRAARFSPPYGGCVRMSRLRSMAGR